MMSDQSKLICRFNLFPICVAQMVKNLLAMWDTWIWSLGWEDPQPTPVFLPGEFHGPRRLVGYSPRGRRIRHDWTTSLSFLSSFFLYRIWKLKRGRKSVGGLSSSTLETRYLTNVATQIVNTLLKACGYNLNLLVFLFKKWIVWTS